MTRESAELLAVRAFDSGAQFEAENTAYRLVGKKFAAIITEPFGEQSCLKIGTILGFDLVLQERGFPSHLKTTIGEFILPDNGRHWLFLGLSGQRDAAFSWPPA